LYCTNINIRYKIICKASELILLVSLLVTNFILYFLFWVPELIPFCFAPGKVFLTVFIPSGYPHRFIFLSLLVKYFKLHFFFWVLQLTSFLSLLVKYFLTVCLPLFCSHRLIFFAPGEVFLPLFVPSGCPIDLFFFRSWKSI
jgi:hypothetical protein